MLNLNCMPNIGAAIGSSLSGSYLDQLNDNLGGSMYFDNVDDLLFKGRQMFYDNIVKPVKDSISTIKNMISTSIAVGGYIPIDKEELLDKIPVTMHMSILQYAPVRKLFDEGRIFGFGYDEIPLGDPYHRLCVTNGRNEDILDEMDKDGYLSTYFEYHGDDPELEWEEMDSVVATREYLDTLLNDTDIDPTDYPSTRA